jgi:hypothetical protein
MLIYHRLRRIRLMHAHYAAIFDPKEHARLARANGAKRPLREIVCPDTGERFESTTQAAKKLRRSIGAIYDAIRTGKEFAGRHWDFA